MTNQNPCNSLSTNDNEHLLAEFNTDPNIQQTENTDFPVAKKMRQISQFKKIYIDFMLEDDLDDFSCGSSDLWSPKDSEIENSPEMKKKIKRKRKKRDDSDKQDKNKIVLPIRKVRPINKKKIRKILMEKGLSYETTSGNTKIARQIKENPCKENKCPRKCYEISEERRQSIFDFFWNLDSQKKRNGL